MAERDMKRLTKMPDPDLIEAIRIETIREIEMSAVLAWPSLDSEPLGGWLLRYSQGVTRRANSVWTNEFHENRIDLAERFRQVEIRYAARGLPARYQLCPVALPTGLDEALASRGYASVAETAVMTAPIGRVRKSLTPGDSWRVELTPYADDRWMATYAAVEQIPAQEAAVRRAIMNKTLPSTAFAAVWVEDDAVAVGSAVWTGEYVGLFNMGTRPGWRRRGAAQAAIAALLNWGGEQGSEMTFLQVMVRNAAARALYERLGYSELYRYHYRELVAV